MSAKLRKVGLVASACIASAAGCSFLAHDRLSPPHVRQTACAIGHVGQALQEKCSPEYQVWIEDVKHFCSDTYTEFADEYHRNDYWPQPYRSLAERSVREPLDLQAANAAQHLATLWDYHFDAGTAQLNSMGQKRLQNIVGQSAGPTQIVYVQRTSSTTETELRLARVREELTLLDLAGIEFDVAEANSRPTEMMGPEAVRAVKRLTDPQKTDGKNASFTSGGGEFKDSGGGSSGNQ
jgi:hypothetical protein